jgi:long-chain acyl-CoA synthetase
MVEQSAAGPNRPGGSPTKPWLQFYDPDVPAHLDYPHIPIYRLLDDTAARLPDRTCAVFFGRRFTYKHIREASDRFAAGIRNLGVRKGMRLGLLLPNSPQFLIAYYGALKAGAVVVPLNPLYTDRELTFHIADSGTETLVTLPMFLEKVVPLRDRTPLKRIIVSPLAEYLPLPLKLVQALKERRLVRAFQKADLIPFSSLLKPVSGFAPEPVDPAEMALLIYSGGTTGTAKGIMLSHFSCVANACQLTAWVNLNEGTRVMAVLPLFHGFGMSTTMNAPIMKGGEVLLIPRFNARNVLKAIQKFRPAILVGVPTMFAAFSNVPDLERYDLSSLQGIFVGAAALTRAVKERFETKTGGRMIEGYGLTECVTAAMANPYHGQHKLGSIGIPFSDVDAKVVDLESGADLGPGQPGEIVLRAPTLMLGYYHDEQETQKTIVDGWLHTGDIGHSDEDGYFYVTDRKKELIIIGGFNVFPREIDELIYAHPKVKEGITVGVPDAYAGERIKVFIVLRDGETATADEFIAYFRDRVVPYKVPSSVEFRTELPKSMIGKILRRPLREEEIRKTTEAATASEEQSKR